MSNELNIALVAEGPLDHILIEAALKAILDKSFVLTQLQPESTTPKFGGGWGGVLKWCHDTSKRHDGSLDDDPTLSNFDLIILHLDVDVSTFQYADLGAEIAERAVQLNWLQLPCAMKCPPATSSANALKNVLKSWLGTVTLGQCSVLCLPAQASGTWLAAAIFNPAHQLLLNAECNIQLEAKLSQLKKSEKIKKNKREYRTKAPQLTTNWQQVKTICPQACHFETTILAAATTE